MGPGTALIGLAAGAVVLGLLFGQAAELPEPTAATARVAPAQPLPSRDGRSPQHRALAAESAPSGPIGRLERAQDRLDQKEAELGDRLAELVESGAISGEEANALERIGRGTIRDARHLVGRAQREEIRPIGLVVRSVPLRIRHAAQVVSVIGVDRAVEIGERRKREEAD